VSSDQHLAQLDEVTVLLLVDLDDTPRIFTSADLAAIGSGNLVSSTNDCERNLGHDVVVLGDGLLVIKLVPGALEDLDAVVLNVG
jgi:hypothetical protein